MTDSGFKAEGSGFRVQSSGLEDGAVMTGRNGKSAQRPSGLRRAFLLFAGLLETVTGAVLLYSGSTPTAKILAIILLLSGMAAVSMAVAGRAAGHRRTCGAGNGHQNLLREGAGASRAQKVPDPIPPPFSAPSDWLALGMGELIGSFNRWSDQQDANESLWASFDRWMRDALNGCIRARRVRCFQVDSTGRLLSLSNEGEEPLWAVGVRAVSGTADTAVAHRVGSTDPTYTGESAQGGTSNAHWPGLIEHVLTTGRCYVHSCTDNGELIESLAREWTLTSCSPHWLLPVREHNRTVGLLLVGELPESLQRNAAALGMLGGLLTGFWRQVRLEDGLAHACRTDQASGVLTRVDLTARAERVLSESTGDGEPLVVLALAVEGIRRLNDQGQWELRDRLMGEIGGLMRRKLRSDDLVGRFSEDHFVAVLRRLDLALGRMIARKLLSAVDASISKEPGLQEAVKVRCGLTDAGAEDFNAAVGHAFEALRQARLEGSEGPLTWGSGKGIASLNVASAVNRGPASGSEGEGVPPVEPGLRAEPATGEQQAAVDPLASAAKEHEPLENLTPAGGRP